MERSRHKWCRCEQRPPDPGEKLCFLCRKKVNEKEIKEGQTAESVKDIRAETLRQCCGCSLAIIVTIALFVYLLVSSW